MIVGFSDEAEHDLEVIGDHIALDNPARARTFVAKLRQKCHALAELPRGFPLVRRYESRGIRKRTHGNYLIFYRITGERITVLHVLHSAMDYGDLLL